LKLKYKHQDFQDVAVNAAVDIFAGQEKKTSTFSIVREEGDLFAQTELGIGNALLISHDQMQKNMRNVQKRNFLPVTDLFGDTDYAADKLTPQFSIEMETGTGKTYVFIKTIFEMNRRYGFTKFIIVVPSVAIREGVYKSFEMTHDHFAAAYDNVSFRPFIYNSTKLSDVRRFAVSLNIEIMIINIDAFKKVENVINQPQNSLNDESAMRYIQDVNPIVIIDEPQSVDSTDKAKDAIANLKPLCVLRYSATHREKINLLYRLTPVDAYQCGLVKQICVSSNQASDSHNQPYIRLVSVASDNGKQGGRNFSAKVEIDGNFSGGTVSRKIVTIKPGADLVLASKGRDIYEGYVVAGIDCTPTQECIEFATGETLKLGKAIGDVDERLIKKAQIRRTIEAHLDKELRYLERGIKVLSLFFIDEVAKYRGEDGVKGEYAVMFEDSYRHLIARDRYEPLRRRFPADAASVHNGYFSQDKKGRIKNTRGNSESDYDTYNTIMRDKEWLLSFDCPLRFIFSHSALKEGWDNPNVFQVCTLIEQKSAMTCRQKVGRGLRLCVDQNGNRIEEREINVLHVMANESFAEFADTLQKEIENETGMKFGLLQLNLFADVVYTETVTEEKVISPEQVKAVVRHLQEQGYIKPSGEIPKETKAIVAERPVALPVDLVPIQEEVRTILQTEKTIVPEKLSEITYTQITEREKTIDHDDAQELLVHFEKKGYVTKTGKIKDTMKNALLTGTLDLPKKFEAARDRVTAIISQADRKPVVRNAANEVRVKLKKQVLDSPEFKALWNRIKQKTSYRIQIDTEDLISRCVKDLQAMPAIPAARIISRLADINIENAGITHTERSVHTLDIEDQHEPLPDVLAIVGEECLVKRATVRDIIAQSGRIGDFINNPQQFMEALVEIIKNNRHQLAIDGIRYVKLAGNEYYVMEIFENEELMANLDINAIEVTKSVYDHVIYDSATVERPFAVALDDDPDVRLFFKIPNGYKIDTPIGFYNPDWAVLLERDGNQQLYLVLETKGSNSLFDLRMNESMKIHCGKEHFKAVGSGVELRKAVTWREAKLKL